MDFDPSKDYYKSLGLSEWASQDEIKKAFRKLAMQHHPDKAGGNKAKFQEVNEAHGVLSDEKKRWQYDMYCKGWWGGMGWFWWAWWWFGWFGAWWFEVDLGDVMDQFFWWGRWGSRGWQAAGDDVQVAVEISFEESFLGVDKTIQFARKVKVSGMMEEECPTCKGRGRVLQQTQTMFGVMQTQNVCPTCQWSGKLYTKDGKRVPGGLETQTEQVVVKVPSGIKDSVYIKYTWKGDAWLGGWSVGDLYVHIRIKNSSRYKRQWDDIVVVVDVSVFDLVLGNDVLVPHPEWSLTIKIPKWTQINDKVRVAKKWFGDKWLFSKTGDLYIIPKLSLPKKLSKEQEKLRSQLLELA